MSPLRRCCLEHSTDFAGGLGFFTLAFLTFFMGASETYYARNIIAT